MEKDRGESAFTWRGRRELVSRVDDQFNEVVAARDQMEQLVRVIGEIGSDLNLDVMLHRIVNAAMELTGARFGALAIRGSDSTLVSFVQGGIDDDTARRLGDLPVGEGLRVDDLSAHPQGVRLHAQEPHLQALLGIPIGVRGADFGSLYLVDDRTAAEMPTRTPTRSQHRNRLDNRQTARSGYLRLASYSGWLSSMRLPNGSCRKAWRPAPGMTGKRCTSTPCS